METRGRLTRRCTIFGLMGTARPCDVNPFYSSNSLSESGHSASSVMLSTRGSYCCFGTRQSEASPDESSYTPKNGNPLRKSPSVSGS